MTPPEATRETTINNTATLAANPTRRIIKLLHSEVLQSIERSRTTDELQWPQFDETPNRCQLTVDRQALIETSCWRCSGDAAVNSSHQAGCNPSFDSGASTASMDQCGLPEGHRQNPTLPQPRFRGLGFRPTGVTLAFALSPFMAKSGTKKGVILVFALSPFAKK
jgi:hypothetical protein